MTITLNRNVILFVVLLVVLGVGGYVIGTGMGGSPETTAVVSGGATAAVPGAPPPIDVAAPPADTAPRVDLATFKSFYDAKEDMLIVDVRSADQFAAGHIAGAVNIPEAEASSRLAELPQDKRIILYCA